ncbi:MAG: YifB family Mg chelatase-like AAA ATPase [Paracoccaceae bacterium]
MFDATRDRAAVAHTVAFHGIEAKPVEVQCATAPGVPAFTIVGLPDKAVSEARERVRAALSHLAIALPSRRITVNLSPADMPKEGSHYDLPVALALLAALDLVPRDQVAEHVAIGELSLDGGLQPVAGALPAALAAATAGRALICPEACAAEAAWVDGCRVTGAPGLGAALRHLAGQAVLPPAAPGEVVQGDARPDLRDVRGQEGARRAIEIAAAGRHHLLLSGPPGSGKSMLAARLPGLLPPLSPAEALETSQIHSLAGLIDRGGISRARPWMAPHHTASGAALIGGGTVARPGQVSLAHNGVLFLDELPEFDRRIVDHLRQPIESGEVTIARARGHVTFPCRFLLVAAANPCRCGHMTEPARACPRAPVCGTEYMSKISGPILDRIDLRVEVPPVAVADLDLPPAGEDSATVAARVAAARDLQAARQGEGALNADLSGDALDAHARPDEGGRALLLAAAERHGLSARGYHRILRVARTIADLEGEEGVARHHLAEALAYRLTGIE